MTLPPEREQLARSKCIRPIELEQNPVTQAEPGQGRCELFPIQHGLVRFRQVRGSSQRARRIFRKKVLVDRFGEDRLHVCPNLQNFRDLCGCCHLFRRFELRRQGALPRCSAPAPYRSTCTANSTLPTTRTPSHHAATPNPPFRLSILRD